MSESEQVLENHLVTRLEGLGYVRTAVTDEASMLANLKAQLEAFNWTRFHDLGRPFRAPVSLSRNPRALPWASIRRTVGAEGRYSVGGENEQFVGAEDGYSIGVGNEQFVGTEDGFSIGVNLRDLRCKRSLQRGKSLKDSSVPKGHSIVAQGKALGIIRRPFPSSERAT